MPCGRERSTEGIDLAKLPNSPIQSLVDRPPGISTILCCVMVVVPWPAIARFVANSRVSRMHSLSPAWNGRGESRDITRSKSGPVPTLARSAVADMLGSYGYFVEFSSLDYRNFLRCLNPRSERWSENARDSLHFFPRIRPDKRIDSRERQRRNSCEVTVAKILMNGTRQRKIANSEGRRYHTCVDRQDTLQAIALRLGYCNE